MSRRNGESEYTQSLKEFCFKGGQRNRGVAGKGYESRVLVVFYFKVGEIMACLCTNRKERGKIDNAGGRDGCWKEILSKQEQVD